MRKDLEERIRRAFIAAILNSDLTPSEIRVLSHELADRPEFASSLIYLLSDIADFMHRTEATKVAPQPDNPLTYYHETIYSLIQRRRLSKKEVSDVMTLISPKFLSLPRNNSLTTHELIEYFLSSASPGQIQKLLERLGAPQKFREDAYMRGILRKD